MDLTTKIYLISCSLDYTIKIWDLENYECVKTLHGHVDGVKCIELISFKESNLISGSLDKSLKMWDLNLGVCTKTFNFHSDGIKCIQALPENKIASGSYQEIKIIDLVTETCLKTLSSDLAWVHSLTILPNGLLASCTECHSISPNGGIELWNISTGGLISRLSDDGDSMELFRCLCLLNNGKIASSSTHIKIPILQSIQENTISHNIKIWNLETERCEKNILVQGGLGESFKNNRIETLGFNQCNELISLSRDGILKIWDLEKQDCIKTLSLDPQNRVMCFKCYKENILITGSSDKKIKFYNLDTLKCIRTLLDHSDTVTDMKFIGLFQN